MLFIISNKDQKTFMNKLAIQKESNEENVVLENWGLALKATFTLLISLGNEQMKSAKFYQNWNSVVFPNNFFIIEEPVSKCELAN